MIKAGTVLLFSILFSAVAPHASGADRQKYQQRLIPAFELPVPITVSEALQALIADQAQNPPKQPDQNPAPPNPDAIHRDTIKLLARMDLAMQEQTIAGVHCYILMPRRIPAANRMRLLVNIHGGGYVSGAGERGLAEAIFVASASHTKTIAIDYRMPPAYPFPAPVDDAVAAWKEIARTHPGQRLGLFGTSAGGAMVLRVTQRAVAEHFALPAAIVAGTPWSDLTETGDSYFTNKYLDPMSYDQSLLGAATLYAGGTDLKDPRLSPIYGLFADFPPVLLVSRTRDLFLSNTARVDRKLRDAGRESAMIVYEGQIHGMYLAGPDVPETRTWMTDVATFFDKHLAR